MGNPGKLRVLINQQDPCTNQVLERKHLQTIHPLKTRSNN